jgi:excisionase family DNA binding protein
MAEEAREIERLVYDVPEAGAKLGLSRNSSYAAAKRGEIPTIKIGKLIRVPKAAFDAILTRAGSK